jgi:hypothetical protein
MPGFRKYRMIGLACILKWSAAGFAWFEDRQADASRTREDMAPMEQASRTVLMIGAAVLAGGLMEGAAFAQAPAAPPAPGAPAFAGAAGAPAAAPKQTFPTPEAPTCVVKAPTDCRLPDGHPDLTGLWVAGGPGLQNGLASGADGIDFPGRGGSFVGHEADGGLYRETVVDSAMPAIVIPGQDNSKVRNVPQYKPQYWDQIIDLDYNGNFEDPAQDCLPNGVPRNGAPGEIIALKDQPFVVLIYSLREIRIVPTDGRDHNILDVATETWNGDPVGHWDGDTLVIETTGFTDASWLHKNGYIHGFDMKVTERITRTGNSLKWEATVDDPEYLLKPWSVTPVTRQLNMDPTAALVEPLPCQDIDHLHTTSHVRSG